jgi:hypothetical protein
MRQGESPPQPGTMVPTTVTTNAAAKPFRIRIFIPSFEAT